MDSLQVAPFVSLSELPEFVPAIKDGFLQEAKGQVKQIVEQSSLPVFSFKNIAEMSSALVTPGLSTPSKELREEIKAKLSIAKSYLDNPITNPLGWIQSQLGNGSEPSPVGIAGPSIPGDCFKDVASALKGYATQLKRLSAHDKGVIYGRVLFYVAEAVALHKLEGVGASRRVTTTRTWIEEEIGLRGPPEPEPPVVESVTPANGSEWVRPKGWRLPKNGTWDGTPGHSNFKPANPAELGLKPGEVVPFRNGRPDFSQWSKGNFTSKETLIGEWNVDAPKMIKTLAEQKGWTQQQAKEWLTKERLSLHHSGGNDFQLIPWELHGNPSAVPPIQGIRHMGGAFDLRNP
jgi:hypothetical protein